MYKTVERNDSTQTGQMLDDSCWTLFFSLSPQYHANHFNYTIYVRVCLLKMLHSSAAENCFYYHCNFLPFSCYKIVIYVG